MNKNSLIYVAGHTGLIGSAVLRRLEEKGYRRLLTAGRRKVDLTDRSKVEDLFRRRRPEYVFLCAAKVGGISANSSFPAEFIYENLAIQTNVIDASYRYKVKKLLFLACPCVYPKRCPQPMGPKHLFTGKLEATNEAFAAAKLAGITMCLSYNKQYGSSFIPVITAGAYGLNDDFGPGSHVISSLIRKFSEAKAENSPFVTVWGSGKPVRDFLYVDDVAEACIFIMNRYHGKDVLNAGSGKGVCVRALADLIKKMSGFSGRVKYDRAKPDGSPVRILDTRKLYTLGWKPKVSFKEGLNRTYSWYREKIIAHKLISS